MKSEKTFSGLAYMFLGAALLVSGATIQEQMERLASDPGLQMAKAMYTTLLRQTVAAKGEFLAVNAAAPMQFDSAVATARMQRVNMPVLDKQVIDVVVPALPNVEVQVSALPQRLSPAHMHRVQVEWVKAAQLAALQSLPEHFRFVRFGPPSPPVAMERTIVLKSDGPKASSCTSDPKVRESHETGTHEFKTSDKVEIDVDAAIADALAESRTEI